MRRPVAILALAAALVAPSSHAAAQRDDDRDGGPQLRIVLPATQNAPPLSRANGTMVVAEHLLQNAKTAELLRNGFSAQVRYRLELWREEGWFDGLESTTEWAALVSYDPVSGQYRVLRRHGNQLEDFGSYATLATAEAPLERPYWVPLGARRAGRPYYYTLTVDVESLSVSDLDELQRWLRGELQPAVRGKNSVGNALKTGLGTLVSRVLGGEKRHYERRSGTFRP